MRLVLNNTCLIWYLSDKVCICEYCTHSKRCSPVKYLLFILVNINTSTNLIKKPLLSCLRRGRGAWRDAQTQHTEGGRGIYTEAGEQGMGYTGKHRERGSVWCSLRERARSKVVGVVWLSCLLSRVCHTTSLSGRLSTASKLLGALLPHLWHITVSHLA